ncbi:MAG TPA: diacylglycerol kinase family protein [Egibacteraceae bacterium]|nr:diacylglycerol kinase family protein [Egibacteraceae bacterium]
MTTPFGRLRLIANPRAGRGTVAGALETLSRGLSEQGVDFDVVETTATGHATRAAREALAEGVRYLCAVGGDGTVHEVVNGMVEWTRPSPGAALEPRPVDREAVLAVAAAGSGSDFARTFGLDRKPEVLARRFATANVMPVDIGVVHFVGSDGNPQSRVFVNIAEVGYGAEVVRRAARMPRFLGRARYLFAAWGAIAALERQETPVTIGKEEKTLGVVELVVANGQFFGGGMKVAPRALPDDNRFNVLVFTGQRSQVFLLTSKMFRGEHLPHPEIVERMAPSVAIAPPKRLLVEADGELLGTTPARFSLLHRAVKLKI